MPTDSAVAPIGSVDRLPNLVADALEFPATARAAFLSEACGDDTELLAEAVSLLQHSAAAGDFLGQPACATIRGGDFAGLDGGSLAPGDALGEYRVLSLLGEGGMGEVYLAEDTRLERRVAVKLLKRRLDDASLASRFRHERRVLAALTHPNIARLYGGGTSPEGRSYLVMEHIEGERLDQFCERKKLGVPERLALFRKVCAAVAYAHQNLVVHRDLKPANIRVTPEGEPKLLDFGIAKLLEPEGSGGTQGDVTVTLFGAMTPEYASPEQIKGEPITTASDVYSLGVLLYELLCGQRPFAHLKGRRADELARAVCEEEPLRASTVALRSQVPSSAPHEPSARLRRLLAGDLDNIVAKALRKEPLRRYASAASLSDDIRRHCEGLPVTARRDTLAYRTGKFVRRNKTAVGAAVLVALALVGGLVATTLEARRANRRFEDVRRLARSILFDIEPLIADLPGNTPARNVLVQRALEYLDDLSREAEGRRDLQRELAAAYEKVGDVQGRPGQSNLGDFPGALSSYLKARALRRALAAAGHDAQARQELAECEEHTGVIQWWSDQTAAAQSSYRDSLALWRALVAEHPREVKYRRGLASVLVRIADVLSWNSQTAEAVATYQEALPILRAVVKADPQDSGLRLDLVRCLQDTADATKELADYDTALRDLAEAETLVEPLVQQEPNKETARRSLWYGLYLQTETLLARKAAARALEVVPRMLALAEDLAKSDPQNSDARHDLAISHEAHAQALDQAHRWPEALEALQTAWSLDTRLAQDAPTNGTYLHSRGTYRATMAGIRLKLGQPAEAEADLCAAQDLLQAAINHDPDNLVPCQELIRLYDLRGDLCEGQTRPGEARQWFGRALQELDKPAASKAALDHPDGWAALREKLVAKTAPTR